MTQSPRAPLISLSTSAVYPESSSRAFAVARELGFDAVEVMVGIDPTSADVDALLRLRDYYEIPVASVHAPTLLLTQRTWGPDPWDKLERSGAAANRLGASVVVVHPPFRWQRAYAAAFTTGIRQLHHTTGVVFAVENMYPWRGPRDTEVRAYSPSWDPSELDLDHLTLDMSHAATARLASLDLVEAWGDRLAHLHLTDGLDGTSDLHLLPGMGNQRADEVLAALAGRGYTGQIVLEVKTNNTELPSQRLQQLADALEFARTHSRLPQGEPR
ncbi:MAG: sugar phosphate isomerase/epimerase family protein [Propionicimonas sp.]|nr:sugar phosphate isomerase/epimerase family protein [Propionicimonas sp.]